MSKICCICKKTVSKSCHSYTEDENSKPQKYFCSDHCISIYNSRQKSEYKKMWLKKKQEELLKKLTLSDEDYPYVIVLLTPEEKNLCIQYGLVMLMTQTNGSYKKLINVMNEQIELVEKQHNKTLT